MALHGEDEKRHRRFLILDEPTSVLTPSEADEVLGMLRSMVVNDGADHPDDHAQIPRGDGVRRRKSPSCAAASSPVAAVLRI